MMKKGFTALKNGTWEELQDTFRKKMKASQDKAEKMSIVQEIMPKNTDYLRRIIAPLEDKEESQCRTCAQTATVSLKTTFGGSLGDNPCTNSVHETHQENLT